MNRFANASPKAGQGVFDKIETAIGDALQRHIDGDIDPMVQANLEQQNGAGVLAAMDSDRGDAVMARAARYKADHAIALERRSVEARDAVAELIEAAEIAADYLDQKGVHLTDGAGKRNLRAALARAQGGGK